MAREELKEKALMALAAVGFVAAGVAFWELVARFMWMCHAAGIPM